MNDDISKDDRWKTIKPTPPSWLRRYRGHLIGWPIAALVIWFFGLGIAASNREQDREDARKAQALGAHLNGPHPLRKLFPNADNVGGARISGSFFLGIGDITTTNDAHTMREVYFAWFDPAEQAYHISHFPLDDISVSFDDSLQTPVAYFRWNLTRDGSINPVSSENAARAFEGVNYILLHIRSQDWPSEIQMPLNGDVPKP